VLLIDRCRRVVKTVNFGKRTYVGDPLNVIRLFNEKEVDEICVLDIDATADGNGPNVDFICSLASECFMPLSYGGGISTIEHARRLSGGGVEKLVLRSHAGPDLLGSIAHEYGRQAVMGCVDYSDNEKMDVAGGFASGLSAIRHASRMVAWGAGEIIFQSIDRDGTRSGMDLTGIAVAATTLSVPVIALGGAGEMSHLNAAIAVGADAAASGSAFCFIGRLRAVLVTYPEFEDRLAISC
jgi:cyclase